MDTYTYRSPIVEKQENIVLGAAAKATPSYNPYPASSLFCDMIRCTMEVECVAGELEVRFFDQDLNHDPHVPFEIPNIRYDDGAVSTFNGRLKIKAGTKWVKDWGTQNLVPFIQIVDVAGGSTYTLSVERN